MANDPYLVEDLFVSMPRAGCRLGRMRSTRATLSGYGDGRDPISRIEAGTGRVAKGVEAVEKGLLAMVTEA